MIKVNARHILYALMLFASACTFIETEQVDKNVNNLYPDNLIEFHLAEASPEMLFIFTAYHSPYSGTFEVITFSKEGSFLRYMYTPGFARKGIIRGTFSKMEVKEVAENLRIISQSRITYSDYGAYNFTVTIPNSSPVVLSCNETNCPKEFCYFYKLTKMAVAKQSPLRAIPSFTGEEAVCPELNK